MSCQAPLALESLVDYLAGELDAAREAQVEEHYFTCASCAARLGEVERLAAGIDALAAAGELTVLATDAVVALLRRRGLVLRQYTLRAGESVNCTAAPDDDMVVVRLAAPTAAASLGDEITLDVVAADLSGGAFALQRRVSAVVDRTASEVVMLFPATLVRTYPRSRWTMSLSGGGAARESFGPFVMVHTPWEQLPPG